MFILWGMLGAITMVVSLEESPISVGGSTANFQEFANLAGNPDVVQLDSATMGSSNAPEESGGIAGAISGTWDFVKQAAEWVGFFARSLLLQSSIWEDWTQSIRWAIMLISLPYAFHVTTVFASAATNMLGGLAGKFLP